MEAVFKTTKKIISLDAVSLWWFILSSSFIAASPKGVAELPSPKIFADIFIDIRGTALFAFLKSKFVRGERSPEIISVSPDFLAIFRSPLQKHIEAISVILSSMASRPLFKTADETCEALPEKTENNVDVIISNENIQLIIVYTPKIVVCIENIC